MALGSPSYSFGVTLILAVQTAIPPSLSSGPCGQRAAIHSLKFPPSFSITVIHASSSDLYAYAFRAFLRLLRQSRALSRHWPPSPLGPQGIRAGILFACLRPIHRAPLHTQHYNLLSASSYVQIAVVDTFATRPV